MIRAVAPIMAVAMGIVLVATSGGGSLYDGDEAVYAEMAREMRATGDVLTLRWDGQPAHQRPPAYIWTLAVFTGVLGEGEGPLRIPSALATALTLLGVAALARRIASSHAVGAAAAAVYASLALTWRYAQSVESDPLLACVCLFAVERFVAALEPGANETVRTRRLRMFGLLLGGACLIKQAVGLLPALAPAAWCLARREEEKIAWRQVVLPALMVWAPWHLAMLMHHGPSFVAGYVGHNVLARATSPVFAPTSPLFYGQVLSLREGPLLTSLLGVGLAFALARAARTRRAPFLIAGALPLVALLLLTAARTRIEYYLVVVTPFLAVCAALVAGQAPRRAAVVAALVFLAGPVAHGWPVLMHKDPSRDVRALAERAHRESLGEGRLVVVGTQTSAPRYYARMPTVRLTTDQATAERLRRLSRFGLPGIVAYAAAGKVCDVSWLRQATHLVVKDGPEADSLAHASCLVEIARQGSYALMRYRPEAGPSR